MSALSTILLLALTLVPSVQDAAADDPAALRRKAEIAMTRQDWPAVVEASRALVAADQDDDQSWFRLGYALHMQGKYQEALEAHEHAARLPGPMQAVATYNAACASALLDDPDRAFQWLEKARDAGFRDAKQVAQDADLDSLRSDPRYAGYLESLKGGGAAPQLRVFAGTSERMATRLFYFDGRRSPGQVAIDYGPVDWKDEYDQQVQDESKNGVRWRLGRDFWTTLDTNVPLTLGGQQVAPGQYYLVVEKASADQFNLVLLDPEAARAQTLDAAWAHELKGGTAIPLDHVKVDAVAKQLDIVLLPDRTDTSRATLQIRFGPYELKAPLVITIAA